MTPRVPRRFAALLVALSGGFGIVGAGMIAAVATGALAAAAPVPPGIPRHVTFTTPAVVTLRARLDASSGYDLLVDASRVEAEVKSGKEKVSSYVGLRAQRGAATVEYSSPATSFDGEAVSGDWGRFGRIEAHFVPARVTHRHIPHCDGDYAIETGRLLGKFVFRGERGYAIAAVRSIAATRYTEPPLVCHFSTGQAHQSHESERLEASRPWHGGQLGFVASFHPALGTVGLLAYSRERRGEIEITRSVGGVVGTNALHREPTAGTASIRGAAPFHGGATFRPFPGKESGTWHGDLRVDLPGAGEVRLAGKHFEGALLKPGECGPDENASCVGLREVSPIGIKPGLPVDRGRG